MPLLANSPTVSLANRILSSLDHKRGWFDNDMHHHNDNGSYARAGSKEEIDRLYDWGSRLDSWTIESLIRAANEARITTVFSSEPPVMDAAAVARPFSWLRAMALLLAAILLSVVIYGAAGMIAGHPSAAALVGVPLALYLKYRK